ncbi:MAG: V-type ATP synthase subunit A [Candidatus Bathyarchaeia archaeon]
MDEKMTMGYSTDPIGQIISITGPVATCRISNIVTNVMMNEIVFVGDDRLFGEITQLRGDVATIQVYEETLGIKRGSPIFRSNQLLSAVLGPGLIGKIYDGLQRPLDVLREKSGVYLQPGIRASKLPRDTKWMFEPKPKIGDVMNQGDILGVVRENELIDHKIMVPPFLSGKIVDIVEEGNYTIDDEIARIKSESGTMSTLRLIHSWPVKSARPFSRKLTPDEPLITGQRVMDFFLPLAKGGSVAVGGGFGTGKTVLEHQLARFLNADIVIYVGCGERGNEIADLLQKFPKLKDPESGLALLEKTILISNTSNMPVAAREASVYTGITLAEYYRDMGYAVVLLVDSTSRWAEALREVSNRMGEMPGEGGYPPYLASRIAEFYGRAGKTRCLGKPSRLGSVSIIASVSPSGGDFSEPVTQKTLQIVRAFWALDQELAYKRHFPAINLQQSFSLYESAVEPFWYENIAENWREIREEALRLHEERLRLERMVRLVGTGALSESEKITLGSARLLEEVFLKQNALHPVDAFCPPRKQFQLLDLVMFFHKLSLEAVEKGVQSDVLLESPIREEMEAMKPLSADKMDTAYWNMRTRIRAHFLRMFRTYSQQGE